MFNFGPPCGSRSRRLSTSALSNLNKQTEPLNRNLSSFEQCVSKSTSPSSDWLDSSFRLNGVRRDWPRPDWRHPARGGLLWAFFLSLTHVEHKRQAAARHQRATGDSYKHKRSLHIWKLPKTFPTASSTNPPPSFSVITRASEKKGDGNSGNTIWKLHLLDSFTAARSVHPRAAPSVSLLDCERYFFILSTEIIDCCTFLTTIQPLHFKEVSALLYNCRILPYE